MPTGWKKTGNPRGNPNWKMGKPGNPAGCPKGVLPKRTTGRPKKVGPPKGRSFANAGTWVPGREAPTGNRSGRMRGAKNKFSNDVRDAMLSAFFDDKMKGYEGFVEWARKHKTEFYTRILIRFLPQDVALTLPDKNSIKLEISLGGHEKPIKLPMINPTKLLELGTGSESNNN